MTTFSVIFSLKEVAAFLPIALATLVGGVWLLLSSPRRGRRVHWAGIGLLIIWAIMIVELSASLLIYLSAGTRRVVHPSYHMVHEMAALTKILIAPIVCVLLVRAAANPLARRSGNG